MKLNLEALPPLVSGLHLNRILTKNFDEIRMRCLLVHPCVRTFVDATTAAVVSLLPDGTTDGDKDYCFKKMDASVNTVTVTPYGTQTIDGAATYVLPAQYDFVHVAWSGTEWSVVSYG